MIIITALTISSCYNNEFLDVMELVWFVFLSLCIGYHVLMIYHDDQ